MVNFPNPSLLLLLSLTLISFSVPVLSTPRFLRGFSGVRDSAAPHYSYDIRYFNQNLDHFSFSPDLPTFRQRYLINTEHWSGADKLGPIFFYCGNEGDIQWFAANTGFSSGRSPPVSALWSFFPRYYGESMPYGSKEVAYKNATTLAHLTAEQALADFSVLITELKRNLSAQACPVVLFGGSYGGMLATWMRLKYPHIAIGALASSAPVLQFEDVVPPETFYDIVSNDFRRESESCFNTIKSSWDVIETEAQKNNGLSYLTEMFRFCKKLESYYDLYDWLETAYSYLAMANYPYPADFLMPLPGNPIKEVCRKIDDFPGGTNVLERIFSGVSIYYNYSGTVDCFDVNDDPHGMEGWSWQACSEMVMPMSISRDAMFPPSEYNYTYTAEECLKNYGVKPRPTWITTEFGGHGLKRALENFGSNIIFSNGLLDPWSGGSVLESISDTTIVALVTEKGAHHLDLRAATAEDPDWLVEQRTTEVKLIRGWLDEYYNKKKLVFDT